MNKIHVLLLAFLCVGIMTSCDKNDEPGFTGEADRTILVYMAANNSLGTMGHDSKDISEMRLAASEGALGKRNRLIVFRTAPGGSKCLMEIRRDGEIDTLRYYDSAEISVKADFMLKVFEDAKAIAPAKDYGLVLWSHAMGWTQNGMVDSLPPQDEIVDLPVEGLAPKTWGDDAGRTMNINILAEVLKRSAWSWVYFDCCFMGSVEVLYEIAPAVKKVVASATEVPLDGMPYTENLPLLFKKDVDLKGAAENTFNYYNSQSGMDQTCTISVYDLTEMEYFGDCTKRIYENANLTSLGDFYNLPLEDSSNPIFFDLGVYIDGLCQTNNIDQPLYDNWMAVRDNVILYYKATPYLWDEINLEKFTGISTFIPRTEGQFAYRGYNTLTWYKDVAQYLKIQK